MDVNQPGVEGLRPGDPERIGDYRLVGRLGEGGMGTVYLATAPAGRAVAVKVIKPEVAIEDGFAARFHAEVRNARRVASFCTAQVLDNGNAEDGRPYMVTEYIAGTPLSRQISTYGALEPAQLHGVALGVAAALAAIHVAGLVHRDLKPANVVLSLSGPRVIDFGIARALDSTHSFTRSGELLGSPGWWAPEQVRGLEVTPAADIFAWGCMIAYAGNGRHPYGTGNLITMATRLLNSRPDLGTLPAPLDDLVRRATAMDPRARPTAQDLLIALVGGGIAAPATAASPADPPTLISDSVLSDSWSPPANVEPDSTQVLSVLRRGTPSAASGSPAPPRPDTQPPPTPATASAAPARRRWLLAGLAVAAALAVTVAVLLSTGEGGGGQARPGTAVADGVTDVGRRIATGSLIGDPQLIVPRPPRCGLTSYEGAAAKRGQLCVIGVTVLNTGGERTPLSRVPLSLVDDLGASHAPAVTPAGSPDGLAPGGRVDGILVYDLPQGRRPAKLVGRVTEGGRKIEVRL
ncbi:serine/threonine-protein kinase [Streptosporangium carneum]|uniref:Protein kinase domain-containing protein n=1 Tax=Streptosporangium carneum TaxID=47481 RepID=A0A9W6MF65_9ACTN|nr:serine/threonine-protein kinase [Streptosporangium carneum]GLK11548.1 hypothetical protein GCM10017600_49550 [Streptosporangium carneum]